MIGATLFAGGGEHAVVVSRRGSTYRMGVAGGSTLELFHGSDGMLRLTPKDTVPIVFMDGAMKVSDPEIGTTHEIEIGQGSCRIFGVCLRLDSAD